jgi:peptidyl-tRNA hydrolase
MTVTKTQKRVLTPKAKKQVDALNAAQIAGKEEQQDRFLSAFEECGKVKIACEVTGIRYMLIYSRWAYEPAFKAKFDAIREAWKEIEKDMAEDQLMQFIADGDKTSVFFKLKCQAKDRGFVENASFDVNIRQIPPIMFAIPTEADIQNHRNRLQGHNGKELPSSENE